MPLIDITDADFLRLQKIAVPLVDTTTSVVTKLLDQFEGLCRTESPKSNGTAPSLATKFGPENIPPLVHTKLMDARFSGAVPEKINWDSFVRLALQTTMKKAKTAKELHRQSGANVVQGRKEIEGYKFMQSQDFSYQGVSADHAAKIIVRCAKALGCEALFEFEWRNKDDAYRPGERGLVQITA